MFGFIVGTLCLIGFIKVWRWGRYGRGYRGGARRWMMRRLFTHLDATPGQEKVITEAVENAQRVMWRARDQFFRGRSAYAQAVRGDSFDEATVNAAFETQQASVDEVKKSVLEGLKQVHEALNPEQRKGLGDLIEFGPARAHGRCGHHSHRSHHTSPPDGTASPAGL